MIKKTLSETRQCEGTKIRPQQSFGRTMLGQIMTTDVGTKKRCDRSDCLVCLDPQSKGGCRQESVTYQINCDRSPCHNRFAKTDPLKPPAPGPGPPALYRGETSRTPYLRGANTSRTISRRRTVLLCGDIHLGFMMESLARIRASRTTTCRYLM